MSGKKEHGCEEKGSDYYVRETRSGSFRRSFRLAGKVDESKIDATYKDGVLSVVIPKLDTSKEKKIEIH